ncbi:MAG: hypothetical protein N3F05_01730 [Candidatus Diapherotrites archaeon]|nr:hypothetical protein [Candidatus Diapherotrites archaeon]
MGPKPHINRPKPPKSTNRLRRLELKIRQGGKQYRYGGSELIRQHFIDNLVRDGYSRGDIELALKILENRPGASRITDMDVIGFINTQIPKLKR